MLHDATAAAVPGAPALAAGDVSGERPSVFTSSSICAANAACSGEPASA
jgi:hypothetical protein